MEYEDPIEDEPEPFAEQPEGEDTPEDMSEDTLEDGLELDEPRAQSSWKAIALTGFLGAMIGAIGGGFGIYAALKTLSPKPVVQAAVDLSPLETQIKRLTSRVTTAEADLKKAVNTQAQTNEPADLSGLETRLQALETAPRPEIDPDALSALQAAQKDGFEWPDVSKLQAQIAELESQANTPSETVIPKDLLERLTALEDNIEAIDKTSSGAAQADETVSALEARLAKLENRPAPAPVVERVSILAFPKATLIDALDANRTGGLIEKTLSRHIRVKDANDPLTLIEGIETDLSAGRLDSAIEKFDRLPNSVKSAGQAWYESVKASL